MIKYWLNNLFLLNSYLFATAMEKNLDFNRHGKHYSTAKTVNVTVTQMFLRKKNRLIIKQMYAIIHMRTVRSNIYPL